MLDGLGCPCGCTRYVLLVLEQLFCDPRSPLLSWYIETGDDCGASGVEDYNQGLAIGSIFILFAVSAFGASLPVLLSMNQHPNIIIIIKIGSYLGCGVLVSTSLVHLLLPANEQLTDPCLGKFAEIYEPWAFMFATATIIFMMILDHFLASHIKDEDKQGKGLAEEASHDASDPTQCTRHLEKCPDEECGGRPLLMGEPFKLTQKTANLLSAELSIWFHSIVIGVALGVSGGSAFVSLLIALVFHQFLEGFALGSATVEAGIGMKRALYLAGIYALTTPIGIAIGIGVHDTYAPGSSAALLIPGIFDSISAGLLLYTVLGDHLNAVKSNRSWLNMQSFLVQGMCLAAVIIGGAAMCVIGKWA